MIRRFALLALLPLAACVAEPYPSNPGYGQPAYGYPASGYGYSDGYPTMVYGGQTVFLVQGGSGWGWYDHERHWHGAPPHINDRLRHDHPQGLPPRAEHQNWSGGSRPPERHDSQQNQFHQQSAPQPQAHQQQSAPQQQFRPQPAAQPAQPQQQERRRDCNPFKQQC